MDDERVNINDRIQQLERERDELRKDIEQLCMQQAGPSYLAVATRMHFQRTAGLEQEIEKLKKKLAICTRNNSNLQEELSEVYHIKSQLADLHTAEVTKNMEAEKQLKFFQGCVAGAFAERDHALMEAEKAKEREDFMSHEVNSLQERLEEMTSAFTEEKSSRDLLQIELTKLKQQTENFEKVVTKFYDIRQSFLEVTEDNCLDAKCKCLLQDAPETWSFNINVETPAFDYISELEKELGTLRSSVDKHQNKMQVGLEIEDHLRKRVHELEKEKILFDDMVKDEISKLYHSHTQHRCEVVEFLENEKNQLKRTIDVLHERITELLNNQARDFGPTQGDPGIVDIECHDVHITTEVDANIAPKKKYLVPPIINPEGSGDTSDAFAQALQEKVDALLLLSQEEERHLLERNVYSALQKKMDELQRNLFQVTNEKVKALMELAQLRQDYQLLQENVSQGIKQGTLLAEIGDKSMSDNGKEGKLKNMLKKTYLRHWISRPDIGDDTHINSNERDANNKRSNHPADFARLKIENATLKESIESMEHLITTVHRLRQSLLKAKESSTSPNSSTSIVAALDNIISEAKLTKTALGSSLPVSWSAKADTETFAENTVSEPTYDTGDTSKGKMDSVSAAGFEMVELLILAAYILKESITQKASGVES